MERKQDNGGKKERWRERKTMSVEEWRYMSFIVKLEEGNMRKRKQ